MPSKWAEIPELPGKFKSRESLIIFSYITSFEKENQALKKELFKINSESHLVLDHQPNDPRTGEEVGTYPSTAVGAYVPSE